MPGFASSVLEQTEVLLRSHIELYRVVTASGKMEIFFVHGGDPR